MVIYRNYLLNYLIPDDVEPNQQEIGYLNIIAPDYTHHNATITIYPVENIVDIQLEFSPPTIIDAVSHGDTSQAIIRDYQGVDDIRYVSVMFLEYRSGVWERREFQMSKASNINEITGVDLIVTNIGFKKALNELLIPAKIPSPTPKIKDIAKPAIPLKIVAEIISKKPFELNSLIVVINVDSGEGKINSELYEIEAIFHITIKVMVEINEIILVFVKLIFI